MMIDHFKQYIVIYLVQWERKEEIIGELLPWHLDVHLYVNTSDILLLSIAASDQQRPV